MPRANSIRIGRGRILPSEVVELVLDLVRLPHPRLVVLLHPTELPSLARVDRPLEEAERRAPRQPELVQPPTPRQRPTQDIQRPDHLVQQPTPLVHDFTPSCPEDDLRRVFAASRSSSL